MSSPKNNFGGKVMAKKVSVYALLTVICLGVSYIEGICFSFIAIPGLKLGLANSIPMLLIKENVV